MKTNMTLFHGNRSYWKSMKLIKINKKVDLDNV